MTRLDRYGDPIEDDDPAAAETPATGGPRGTPPALHDPTCRDGWLGEDQHGRPIPCLDCRPHLRPRSQ